MPCRVGITTKPEEKRAYLQNQVEGFANWQVINTFRSRVAAKEYGTGYALRNGYESSLDDPEPPSAGRGIEEEYNWWYVYSFEYGSPPEQVATEGE